MQADRHTGDPMQRAEQSGKNSVDVVSYRSPVVT